MNPELKAIVGAQDVKLEAHNTKPDTENVALWAKVERLESLSEGAEGVAEQMMQLRRIEAEKELLLVA